MRPARPPGTLGGRPGASRARAGRSRGMRSARDAGALWVRLGARSARLTENKPVLHSFVRVSDLVKRIVIPGQRYEQKRLVFGLATPARVRCPRCKVELTAERPVCPTCGWTLPAPPGATARPDASGPRSGRP